MKTNGYRALLTLMSLLCFIFTTSRAQQKKELTPKDYPLWKSAPKIISAETSEDGTWYAFKTGNENLIEIHIKNIKNGLSYNFNANITKKQHLRLLYYPKVAFSKDGKWYAFTSNDTLHLLNLNSGKKQIFKGVSDVEFAGRQYLVGTQKDAEDKSLWLKDLRNNTTLHIDQVSQFNINPDGTAIAIIANDKDSKQVKMINLRTGFPVSSVTSATKHDFTGLTWNTTGNSLAFYETKGKKNKDSVYKIHLYNDYTMQPKLKSMDPNGNQNLPKDYVLKSNDKLHLSPDGKQLFFYLTKNDVSTVKPNPAGKYGIEVWLPTDLSLPPGSENQWYDSLLWYQWRPESNNIMPVTDGEFTCATLTGDGKNALIYHTKDYLPQYKYFNSFLDVYVKNLKTGKIKLVVKKIWDYPNQLSASPGGKYVAYFKDKNWWVYDIENDSRRCLTEGWKTTLEDLGLERVATVPAFESPGWLKNDSDLIIYDQNDIWLLSPDGKKKLKITNGAETGKTFRVYKPVAYPTGAGPGSAWFTPYVHDGTEGLLITSQDNETLDNGLCMWNAKYGLKTFINKPMKIDPFGKVSYNKPFLFQEGAFDVPPRLMFYKPWKNTEILYETNPHQRKFKWGKSELVHFTTPDGKRLKGALFYPAGYVAGKKYPMVVNIYEKKSQYLHDYQIPSLSEADAHNTINVTNYTLDGYFVFLPDISYELNDPGVSANRCVVAGVEKVIEMGLADRENIGLVGFSFGGYETSFIATQTDLFKTAIAGAGITDISSWAVLISQFGPNFNRIEQDQHRMNKEFLGEDYKRNSPMTYVHQMKTPILLYSGDKDTNVDVSQTKSFHTALWRLGKQSTMLIYKGENHSLQHPDNQIDITRRCKDWFDHYLKGEKPADWMVNGDQKVTTK